MPRVRPRTIRSDTLAVRISERPLEHRREDDGSVGRREVVLSDQQVSQLAHDGPALIGSSVVPPVVVMQPIADSLDRTRGDDISSGYSAPADGTGRVHHVPLGPSIKPVTPYVSLRIPASQASGID